MAQAREWTNLDFDIVETNIIQQERNMQSRLLAPTYFQGILKINLNQHICNHNVVIKCFCLDSNLQR